MDFSLISSAVSAINGAIDLGKGVLSVRDETKAIDIVRAMNEKLLDAQQRLFELSAALNSLQHQHFQTTQELREVRETLAERGRYTLVALSDGQFVYRVDARPALGGAGNEIGAEPEHYVCQKCVDGPAKSKSVLQKAFSGGMAGRYVWKCFGCNMTLNLGADK